MATTPVFWDSCNTYVTATDVANHYAQQKIDVTQSGAYSRTGTGSIRIDGGDPLAAVGYLRRQQALGARCVVNFAYLTRSGPLFNGTYRSIVKLTDAAGDTKAEVGIRDIARNLEFRIGNTVILTGNALPSATIFYFEVAYYSHPTVGYFYVWQDGVQVFSYDGATEGLSVEPVGRVQWGALSQTGTSGASAHVSDIVLAEVTGTPTAPESRLGPIIHSVITPSSDIIRNSTPLSGADAYPMVDEVPHDGDTTYTDLANVGDRDIYAHSSALPADTVPIGVAVFTAQRLPAGGTSQVRHVLSNGVTDINGADLSVGGDYAVQASFWQASPFNAAPWTKEEVEALRFGFEARV